MLFDVVKLIQKTEKTIPDKKDENFFQNELFSPLPLYVLLRHLRNSILW